MYWNFSLYRRDPRLARPLQTSKTDSKIVTQASAAVPGILNPVVLMMKKPNGTLTPYSFGHKWKDGRYVGPIGTYSNGLIPFSLRTDIPLKALNLHFGVNFSIVSQVNPHINLFFFSSRGAVGRPGTYNWGNSFSGDSRCSVSFASNIASLESLV